jgi:3-phenylpropionate/cinnamic acid dioxygenase small subunit
MKKNVELYLECVIFLNQEAEYLDDGQLDKWIGCLTDDIDYRVPVRVTSEKKGDRGFSKSAYNLIEDMDSIKTRVARLNTEYAWSEQPATRIRHIISNVRAVEREETLDIEVKSNFLLYRGRGDALESAILCGERVDVLKRMDGELKIAKRTVYLDQTTLPISYISFFI